MVTRRYRTAPGGGHEHGFTLLELLVVIAVLGMLAALVGPQVLRYLGTSRSETASVQIRNITAALDLYRLDNGELPADGQGLAALVADPGDAAAWAGPYLPDGEALRDPWGRTYLYRNPGTHGEVDVYTLGADNKEGGEGEDRDVGNWAAADRRAARDEALP